MMTKNLQQPTQSELKFIEGHVLKDIEALVPGDDSTLEYLLEKQEYLEHIDADMTAFYEVKAEALGLT